MQTAEQELLRYWVYIKSIGVTPHMEEYEKRKMSIFNQLNFFGMISGVVVPLIGLLNTTHLPPLAWFVAYCPLAIGILVLWLNYEQYYEIARIVYFSLYPVITCMVYLGQVDVGIELFFILYGVLSVFFLREIFSIIFCFSLSITCYFIASVVFRNYYFRLELVNYWFYVFNHLLAVGFIFYALYMLKKENTGYQYSLIAKSREVHKRNLEIEEQRREIAEKAALLEQQTRELTELNQVKNKLFSVISHDLKTPMYAMRNMFNSMQQYRMSAKEIKDALPEISNEMNYVISLMENLLQWSKTQMQSHAAQPELLDLQSMTNDVFHLLQLQATNKSIYLESKIAEPLYCYADREMINVVLRNLVSNAIKFTPENGNVMVGIGARAARRIEVFVKDSGIGMSPEMLQHIFGDAYFSTRGTNHEAGTGLGLKLCKEFLEKNGGEMTVKSQLGKGSTFTFSLPRHAA